MKVWISRPSCAVIRLYACKKRTTPDNFWFFSHTRWTNFFLDQERLLNFQFYCQGVILKAKTPAQRKMCCMIFQRWLYPSWASWARMKRPSFYDDEVKNKGAMTRARMPKEWTTKDVKWQALIWKKQMAKKGKNKGSNKLRQKGENQWWNDNGASLRQEPVKINLMIFRLNIVCNLT